ncbi:hypothetical protein N9J72_03040 [Candidatus Gracilibacteria bacterium]|nr:hypothetical protein [Candidatus Gracilibacteria bacterium]
MGNILILGPSGSGKTTLKKKIINQRAFQNFVADTSREAREGEIDGEDYNFISAKLILLYSKIFYRYLIEDYYGNFYGYNLSRTGNNSKSIIAPGVNVGEEILTSRVQYGIKLSILITLNPSLFRDRLERRGSLEQEIKDRIKSLQTNDLKKSVDLVIDGSKSQDDVSREVFGVIDEMYNT